MMPSYKRRVYIINLDVYEVCLLPPWVCMRGVYYCLHGCVRGGFIIASMGVYEGGLLLPATAPRKGSLQWCTMAVDEK